ncbi:unnamed protein product [Pleuronectes platessa]|uniref:Uncharacterized protein n=1 Tax=Pleuronectes platessa TaxID=8262 RepID=A0A9N7UV93_PLEPL|nr:unnamed protein product [Pleuronectes platessa]
MKRSLSLVVRARMLRYHQPDSRRQNSLCLVQGGAAAHCSVCPVMFTGQVITDVDPEETEAADSLHRSPVDGEGGMFYSLSLPVVHDQLLCFADIEMEVVVLTQRCQGSDLLSVGLLVVSSANLMMVLELWVARQSCMNREYRRGLSTQPWGGTSVYSQGGGCGADYPYRLWSARQEVQDLITEGDV